MTIHFFAGFFQMYTTKMNIYAIILHIYPHAKEDALRKRRLPSQGAQPPSRMAMCASEVLLFWISSSRSCA